MTIPASDGTPSPSQCGTETGLGCAPDSARVDLYEPSFSDPTNVTNPLFPISNLHSAVLLGHVEGKPFRTETTLLPETRTIAWNGRQVETLVSQYMAFLDGRIEEIALDMYAQADDGSVWYFGEDVSDYADGVVYTHEGTWMVNNDTPLAMIMPADPRVGDVYRAENAPGIVWEEVTVQSVGVTVAGPSGPVDGAMVGSELHVDGTREEKVFAPGYGEFSTGTPDTDLEALALAVPIDALPEALPAELETLASGAAEIFDAAQSEDWDAASALVDAMTAASDTYLAGQVPEMLRAQLSDALDALVGAVDARNAAEARQASIDVIRAGLDLQLRYRPVAEIDLARFDLWARQILVDAAADDKGAVTGDVATLERVLDRFAHILDGSDVGPIDSLLGDLRIAADAEDITAAADSATQLRDTLAGLEPSASPSARPLEDADDEDDGEDADEDGDDDVDDVED